MYTTSAVENRPIITVIISFLLILINNMDVYLLLSCRIISSQPISSQPIFYFLLILELELVIANSI